MSQSSGANPQGHRINLDVHVNVSIINHYRAAKRWWSGMTDHERTNHLRLFGIRPGDDIDIALLDELIGQAYLIRELMP